MKKIIFTLVMMVSSMVTFAQNEVGKFSITPKAGVVASQVMITEDSGSSMQIGESRYKAGLTGGVELNYQAKKWFGISAGALYTQLGANGREGKDIKLNYDYITTPVLANFYPCKGLCLKIGVQPSFNINAKATEKGHPMEHFGSDNIRKFDVQVPVGISYETRHFIIDARYNVGVMNMFKKATENGSTFRMNNSYATLTVGYKFNL